MSKAWAIRELGRGKSIPVISDVFQLRLVRNSGSAFGLFAKFPIVIFLVNVGIMALVILWALRSQGPGLPLGLVIGGGLGNLADRILRPPGWGLGKVVDFLYLPFWPTFNLADTAIVIGVFLLVLDGVRPRPA